MLRSILVILMLSFFVGCATVPVQKPMEPIPPKEKLLWTDDFVGAIVVAEHYNMPMMVYIDDDGHCNPCRDMDKTFENQKVVKYLNEKFVSTRLDIDDPDSKRFKVTAYPVVYFVRMNVEKKKGEILGYRTGHIEPKHLIKILDKVIETYNDDQSG